MRPPCYTRIATRSINCFSTMRPIDRAWWFFFFFFSSTAFSEVFSSRKQPPLNRALARILFWIHTYVRTNERTNEGFFVRTIELYSSSTLWERTISFFVLITSRGFPSSCKETTRIIKFSTFSSFCNKIHTCHFLCNGIFCLPWKFLFANHFARKWWNFSSNNEFRDRIGIKYRYF